ncbi:MAG: secondary thiamine-phosphate synthase enzyme YjbQ [Bdellovibrionales bacterium]|nr:secondary thiamine-phosphate synthase enzyme YjbQ [Bdellovibrionales bacterium]
MVKHKLIEVQTQGKGLYEITERVRTFCSDLNSGILNLFIKHTSASLVIQENADPTARKDLQTFLEKLAPENQSWHEHTFEGPDDTTSHLKSAITNTQLSIPIFEGQLGLGTWQGIYVWEHRDQPHNRKIIISTME